MNVNAQRLAIRSSRRPPWLLLVGPAFAVSIGYIDPGNWATDLAAGAFGMRLLWVVVFANAIALVLQVAVVRLTALTGRDLGTLIARGAPWLSRFFWAIFQGAAIATDLAEFTGIVLGLSLLLHWPFAWCVGVGLAIVLLALSAGAERSKLLEGLLMTTVGVIALAFVYQVWCLHPSAGAVAVGLLPWVGSKDALVLVIGIIGATVMPHNLFLHSAMMNERNRACTQAERFSRARFFSRETLVALNIATFINAAILIVGASLVHADGSIADAYSAWSKVGAPIAALLFGSALVVTGIAASTTATLSGDYIFRSFSTRNVRPLLRRAVTLGPAAIALLCGARATSLLIWSQVALALILPVALVPMMLEYRRAHREHARSLREPLYVLAWSATVLCIVFDAVLLFQTIV